MPLSWEIFGLIAAFAAGGAIAFIARGPRRAGSVRGPRSVLLENLEDPWVIVDRNDRIVDLNSAAAVSLGTSESQARGASAAALLAAWPGVQKLGKGAVDKTEVTLNGLPHELTVRPCAGGRVLHLRSIADRKRLEEDLRHAKQAADMADRAKSQFLAMMSHEIRTPLNGVVGFTELLQDTTLDAEQREFAQLAVQSGRSLLVIIDDVLDYTKIETGKLVLEDVPVDLAALMEGNLSPFQPKAAAKNIGLSWTIDPATPPRVRGDPTRIAQILNNLVANAVKFTQSGGVTVRLSGQVVSAVNPPVAILSWEVADTGIGIAPDALAQLVRPFAQADLSTTRTHGGTGLGLVITRRLCELMGGRLQVASEVGKGSTFTATLHSTVEGEQVPRPPSLPAAQPGRPLKALMCEDNEINRRLLRALMIRRGHAVTFAEDGVEGLAAVESSDFDLIFVDLAMPRMDGREFVRRVRQREAERGEPARHLIALTASALKGERERCLAEGLDDFLTKPLDQSALDQALASFCAMRPGDGPAVRDSNTAPAS